jgi:hypothetical protein
MLTRASRTSKTHSLHATASCIPWALCKKAVSFFRLLGPRKASTSSKEGFRTLNLAV